MDINEGGRFGRAGTREVNIMQILLIAVFHNTGAATTNDPTQNLNTGLKIGIWSTGISIPGFIAMLMGAFGLREECRVGKFLAVVYILALLSSTISGGTLLILGIFRPDIPSLIAKIKAIMAVAIASMAFVLCTGFGLQLCKI